MDYRKVNVGTKFKENIGFEFPPESGIKHLTNYQLTIFKDYCLGRSAKEIANKFDSTSQTISGNISKICNDKLGNERGSSRALIFALYWGIVDLRDVIEEYEDMRLEVKYVKGNEEGR